MGILVARLLRFENRKAENTAATLVALFVNTVAFNDRCIPQRRVDRRSHTLGMLAFRALRCGRLGRLGTSPYRRTGPLSAFALKT
jgi:hypothetical protein